MRALSPLELALAGTIAVHLLVVTAADALIVTHPPPPLELVPHIEMVNIDVPPVLTPPPPPVAPLPAVAPIAPIAPIAPPPPTAHRAATAPSHAIRAAAPVDAPPTAVLAKAADPTPTAGGDPVYHMDNIAPSATGVAVGVGPRTSGHIGRGGTGGGTAAGSGTGASSGELAVPMSVATIKTRALPKPGFDYVDLGRDYPVEAKQLGIEGKLHVRLVVDKAGKVVQSRLLDHLGHGLDELALDRAKTIEFTPAVDTTDAPVTSVVVWTFEMRLPK